MNIKICQNIAKSLNILRNNNYQQFTIKTLKFMYYTKNIKQTTLRNYLKKLVNKGKLKKVDKFRYAFTSEEIKLSDFYNQKTIKRTRKVYNETLRKISKLTGIDINELDSSLTEEYKDVLDNIEWEKAKELFELEQYLNSFLKV